MTLAHLPREERTALPRPRPDFRTSATAPVRLAGLRRILVLLAGLHLTLPPGHLTAQGGNPTQRAAQLLAAGDAEAAVEVLEPFLAEHAEAAAGWLTLARARVAMKSWDEALAAAERAEDFPQTAGAARVERAIALAGRGEGDQAFDLLRRVREEGRVDLTAIAVQSRAAPLTEDPRFSELLPTQEEFADPFVEDVRVIREWRGEAPGGAFGWIARNIGDVDGDGIPDVTTSAPDLNQGTGRIYVFSTGTGERLWSADGDSPGERFGAGIEAAGDVNGDGIPDVIAGGPGTGRAVVFSGRDGEVLRTFRGDPSLSFGRRVSDVGDVNGDGFADVVVGAPGAQGGGGPPGEVRVYSGRDGSVLLALQGTQDGDQFGSSVAGAVGEDGTSFLVVGAGGGGPEGTGRVRVYRDLQPEPFFVLESDETGGWLGGMFVSIPGDVNGDGIPDVYASDWANAAKGPQTGRIYVLSGADGSEIFTLTGEAAGEGFGTSPSDAGDLDGDGFADLAVGAWQHASGAPGGGRISVYSGRSGTLMWTLTGKVMGETLGFDSTGMGDLDGDGIGDLLVTSAWSFVNGPRSGRVYIVAGREM